MVVYFSLLALLGLTLYAVVAVYQTGISRHRLNLPLRQALRIVQLSDMHLGPYIGWGSLQRWLALANAERPDVVVITGDIFDRWFRGNRQKVIQQLATLQAPLGVYVVWGNHEYKLRLELLEFTEALEAVGIRVLLNDGVKLREDVFLAGVDDLRMGKPSLVAALRKQPREACTILLSHSPDILPYVPIRVNLVLCGHTHGGQIRLPLLGALITSSRYGQRYAMGWVEAPVKAYISRGLGVSTIPLRLNCPSELVVFDVLPHTQTA